GGGGILDVGCYCTSMARLIAGVALGKDFAEPIAVSGCGHIGQSRVDDYAVASLKFPGGILAQLATGVQLNQESVVRIFGSEGSILVPSPWFCARDGGASKIIVQRKGGKAPREIVVESPAGIYSIEADTVAANIAKRQAPSPAMSWADTLGNMRTLDQWRTAVGMVYDSEKPEANIPTVDRRPLAVRPSHKMKYGRIEGLDKPISRLVMGTMLEGSTLPLPHATVLFDEFFRAGGNAFDTAVVYGSEKILGQWIKNRGLRDQVVILAKGAHTPFCDPKNLTEQLLVTLDRLQTSYVDIYMMHRDNPDIPVGEFIDVLNEHKRLGRIRLFGGSNWSIERVKAANRYAKRKGLAGFSAVSNNFSLARMVEPVWAGCVAASDPESRRWHKKTQMPVFSWSSQARGFFTGRARPDDKSDKELARCWYSDDNFKRLARATELAQMRGALPINIALAYVLNQPFPTYALIGPRTLTELSTSLPALDIELTPDELRRLNLEA
ncbi:MAG: oxidoreductase, partial [Planctomycetes bacterium]|nr:oxidoreductase [Planctomycetota bacterium]